MAVIHMSVMHSMHNGKYKKLINSVLERRKLFRLWAGPLSLAVLCARLKECR